MTGVVAFEQALLLTVGSSKVQAVAVVDGSGNQITTFTVSLSQATPGTTNGVNFHPSSSQLSIAPINFSASGDNTVISAGTGAQTIKVYRLYLVVTLATNILFKDGVVTDGAVPLSANGAITLDFDGEPWFAGAAATAFKINSSVATQVSGRVYYITS